MNSSLGARRQQGFVLIVAMVMLVIIGLMSASVMRGALSADVVANNARSQASAMQAAQIALRYCEREVAKVPAGVTVLAAPADNDGDLHTPGPTNWNTFANWKDASKRTELTDDIMRSEDSSFKPSHMPQCMAENVTLEDATTTAIVITARGFSPDYQETDEGKSTAGAAVWVQSTLKLN
ncbi:MAG TPA: hypothetical protein VLA61_13365 [Ideonella sp.]|uniref:pilus assembly PilX family protein n=1 Tax=Ideonella sp. TaxID=1929293 RepID=UPI002B962788|nr:hypothetical protein [Ideonella sp.]HSI49256.1 hypothetical protein [Ideonella sp.]